MRSVRFGALLLGVCVLSVGACKADDDDDSAPAAGSGAPIAGSSAPSAGTGGTAPAKAAATLAPFGDGTVTGTAMFTQAGTDVTVVVTLSNCPDGMHGVHIHQGTSCADAMAQGAHWDMTRGEGIPSVMCAGGTGTATLTRTAVDPILAWSVGGAATTNVIGHAFVVHNPGDPAPRIGCGLIAAQ